MDQHRQHKHTASANLAGFRLPPGVSITKQTVSDGWAYLFRHHSLGQLGRIVLRETADGRTHITFPAKWPAMPMTP